MKKLCTILLALAMIFTLAACSSGAAEKAEPETNPAENTAPVEPAEPAEEETDEDELAAALAAAEPEPTEEPIPEDAVSEVVKACYGEWQLVKAEGFSWDARSESDRAELLEIMKEHMQFELGEPSYFVQDQIWTEFELLEKDGVITSDKSPYGGFTLSIENGVLTLRNQDVEIYTFEKVSDTPRENPYWYYGSYALAKIRENTEGAEWQDAGYAHEWDAFVEFYAGMADGVEGMLPGPWAARLDMDALTLTAKDRSTGETRTGTVEFTDEGMIVTCDDTQYLYVKGR